MWIRITRPEKVIFDNRHIGFINAGSILRFTQGAVMLCLGNNYFVDIWWEDESPLRNRSDKTKDGVKMPKYLRVKR